MGGTVEDFLAGLSAMDRMEAERIYQNAGCVNDFPRIELEGAHTTLEAGIQMVYAIGVGKIDSTGARGLHYISCFSTGHFFKEKRDNRDVLAISVDNIGRISPVHASSESFYGNGLLART